MSPTETPEAIIYGGGTGGPKNCVFDGAQIPWEGALLRGLLADPLVTAHRGVSST